MTRAHAVTSVILLLALFPLVRAASPELYAREVDEPAGAGKPLRMRFEEIERAPRYSVVQVTHTSGASVPSVMFVVRGMWEMAHQRRTPFFIKLREWTAPGGKWLYKVGFASSDQVDVHSYFGEAPEEAKFLSVQEYDRIFRD